MSGFSIASLRHRVVLERPVAVADGAGGESVSFQPVRSVWARVRPKSLGRLGRAGGTLASGDYTITVRRWTDIAPGWRVVFEDEPLAVESVEPVFPRLLYLKLQCRGGGA
jgi:SPP1 family predicted phage head-tail adaptor